MHERKSTTCREAKWGSFSTNLLMHMLVLICERSLFHFSFYFVLLCVYWKVYQNIRKCYFFIYWIVELILDWFVRGYVGLKLFKLKQEQAPSLKRRSTNSFNILVLKCVNVHASYQEKLYKYTSQWMQDWLVGSCPNWRLRAVFFSLLWELWVQVLLVSIMRVLKNFWSLFRLLLECK